MAIIYSYPTVIPTGSDLVLGTDVDKNGNPTKNFTVQSIIDLVSVTAQNLNQVLTTGNDAIGLSIVNLGNLGSGSITNTGSIGTSTLTATGVIQAETFQTTAGAATWSTTVLAGFTSISTETVTVSGAFAGAALLQVITTPVAPATGSTTKIASEKAIIDYIATNPVTENLFKTLQSGNKAYDTTVAGNPGFDIDMGVTGTSNGNILFGDNKKIRIGDFGVTYPLELFYGSDPGPATDTVAILQNKAGGVSGIVPLTLRSNILDLSSVGSVNPSVTSQKYLTATKYVDAASTGVLLYYNNTKKFETTAVGVDVTGIMTTDNIVNPGYYNASNGVGTAGQLLSSTVTGTNWIANPNPTPYLWKIEGDSGAITTVANADTIHFKGMNDGGTPLVGITTAFVPSSKELRITANGLADGDGQAGEVAFWSGTGLTSTLAGDTGMTYDAATDNLTVVGIIQGGTLSDGTASINSGVGAAFKSITTTISTTTNNANGFFGPLRTNAASTNYAAGVADQAVQLTGTGTINLNAGGSEVSSTTGTYKAGAVIALDVTLNNDAVIGKVLTGLSVPATGNSIEPDDSILIAFGKLQAQHNTSVNGLRYIGTWDARTQAEGGSAGDEGNPALADGGGVITTGTNTSVVADELVDSGKNFTALGVSIGERVYNQAGTFTTVSAVGTTTLTLNEDIFLTNGQTYSVDNNPALSQGEYYVVNQAGTVDLNGIVSWAIGDWVIAGAGNTWEKLDQTGVDGTGSINRIPRWDTVSSLNDSIILQSATGITLDTGKNFATQGAGTITSAAMLTAAVDFTLTGGINLPTGYGGSGQVLTTETAGGGTGTDMVWTTPTTGTLTGITAGTGITTALNADGNNVTVSIDYLGTDNFIEAASATYGNPNSQDTMVYSERNSGAASDNVKKFLIGNLPFNNYSWKLGDGASNTSVSIGSVVNFIGSDGINAAIINSQDLSIKINYVGANNAILSAGAGTPIATDELLFNNADVGTNGIVQRASIADIVDLGNETLAQVLANDNVTGNNDIVIQDNITFSDANGTNSGNIIMGTGSDMSMGYDGDYGLELVSAAGAISGGIRMDSPLIQLRDLTSPNAKKYFEGATGGAVKLYYDGTQKFQTTNTGTTTTGVSYITGSGLNINSNTVDTLIYLNRTTGIWSIDNDSSYYLNFKATSLGTTNLTLKSTGEVQMPDYGSGTTTGTPTFNLEVDSSGNIIETPSTNPGGGGGTFHGDQLLTLPAPSVGDLAFTLNRATTGTLIFDVWFTSETSTGTSVAKKYTVAHAYATDPVYNKIIDTGPMATAAGGVNDFIVIFANAGSGLSVTCSIQAGGIAQNIGYTVQVGYDSTNALTFTAAS